MDERRAWQQHLHAQLFHQGAPPIRAHREGREALAEAELSPASRQMVEVALDAIDHLTELVLAAARRRLGRPSTVGLGRQASSAAIGVARP